MSPDCGRDRTRAHPCLPERPGGPRGSARFLRSSPRDRNGALGISRGGRDAGAPRLRAGHARVSPLATLLGARAGQAAVGAAPPARGRLGLRPRASGDSGVGKRSQRLLRPAGAPLLSGRGPGERSGRSLRRQRRRRDSRAGARDPRRDPAGPLGRPALRGGGVSRSLRRSGLDLRRAGRARPGVGGGLADEERPRPFQPRLAPGRRARRGRARPLRLRRRAARGPARRRQLLRVRRPEEPARHRARPTRSRPSRTRSAA